MAAKILLIEDDAVLAEQVLAQLRRHGFSPLWWSAYPHPQGDELKWHDLELVILDLMLPGTYGLDILKEIRKQADVPVLILSGRNDTTDKVRALKLGADDYLTKPFWPEELLERIAARLRRPMLRERGMELGELKIDLTARAVCRLGVPLELTRIEFDLLAALVRRAGAAIPRAWLLDNILDQERGSAASLDAHISRLRKKLGPHAPIETVWGIGYRLRVEES